MTVSENLPRVQAVSHPSKISFPSITTTCSLPITEVKAVFLFLIALAEFCYVLYKFELLRVEIRIFPHDACATAMQRHGLKASGSRGHHWKLSLPKSFSF